MENLCIDLVSVIHNTLIMIKGQIVEKCLSETKMDKSSVHDVFLIDEIVVYETIV